MQASDVIDVKQEENHPTVEAQSYSEGKSKAMMQDPDKKLVEPSINSGQESVSDQVIKEHSLSQKDDNMQNNSSEISEPYTYC